MGKIDLVRNFIVNDILFGDGDALEDNTSFYDSGIIDSTGILEIVSFIEKQFNIRVETHELVPDNFESLSCVAEYLEKKIG